MAVQEVSLVAERDVEGESLAQSLQQRGLRVALGAESVGMDPRLVVLVGDADYCKHAIQTACRDRLGRAVAHYTLAVLRDADVGAAAQLLEAGFDDVVCGVERGYEITLRLHLGQRRLQDAHRQAIVSEGYAHADGATPLDGDRALDDLAAIGTLAAGVAHEINNPLTYIRGNLEYALQLLDVGQSLMVDQDLVDALSDAREGTVRVADIVSSLKTFSRADVDDADEGPTSLPRVMAVALRLTRNEIRNCADISAEGLDTLPRVRGSKARLAQSFVNLLLNAAQAIERRPGGRGLISVTGKVVGDSAVVEIRDDGVGVPPEQQRRIFDPFFSTRPVGKGRGLGLTLAYNFISRVGGRLELQSSPDWGSLFRVTLPITGLSTPVTWSTAPEQLAAKSLDILVVDDERSVLTMLHRMLTAQHRVELASTVAEANASLSKRGFDAVLCDLMMSEGGGRAVFEKAISLDGSYGNRFVFMTGGAFRADDAAFVEEHAPHTLSKPIEFAALQGLLRNISNRD